MKRFFCHTWLLILVNNVCCWQHHALRQIDTIDVRGVTNMSAGIIAAVDQFNVTFAKRFVAMIFFTSINVALQSIKIHLPPALANIVPGNHITRQLLCIVLHNIDCSGEQQIGMFMKWKISTIKPNRLCLSVCLSVCLFVCHFYRQIRAILHRRFLHYSLEHFLVAVCFPRVLTRLLYICLVSACSRAAALTQPHWRRLIKNIGWANQNIGGCKRC